MLINGFTNFILFKLQSLKMFYLVLYPFILLFMSLMIVLFPNDKLSFWLASLYLVWLGYDLFYFQALWKMNEHENRAVS